MFFQISCRRTSVATMLTVAVRLVVNEIFESAKKQYGGVQQLFAAPLTFSDEQGISPKTSLKLCNLTRKNLFFW